MQVNSHSITERVCFLLSLENFLDIRNFLYQYDIIYIERLCVKKRTIVQKGIIYNMPKIKDTLEDEKI